MSDDKGGEQPSSPSLGTKSGFADPLLEFLTQAEDKERKGQSKTPAPKNSVAGDFKKLEEVDGDDFLSLVAQHAKKKPPTKSAYQVQEEELEKELSAPFAEPPRPVLSQMYLCLHGNSVVLLTLAIRIDEFDSLWEKENESDLNFDLLNLKAQKGGLQNTKLRGLCWKVPVAQPFHTTINVLLIQDIPGSNQNQNHYGVDRRAPGLPQRIRCAYARISDRSSQIRQGC